MDIFTPLLAIGLSIAFVLVILTILDILFGNNIEDYAIVVLFRSLFGR